MTATDPREHDLPADLAPIAGALDALARHDAAAAPRALEDRAARASLAPLRAAAAPAPIRIARFLPSRALRLAAAAAVLLAAALTITVLNRSTPPIAPTTIVAATDEALLDTAMAAVDGALASIEWSDTDRAALLRDLASFNPEPQAEWSAEGSLLDDSM